MWYVIQVMACHESEMVNKCQKIIKDGEEVFTMFTERMERRDGRWQARRFVTFQKYIFVETSNPDDFRIRLQSVSGLTKMLGVGEYVIPIRTEEEEFLRCIGGSDHIIGKSYVYNEGDKVKVISGPLSGMEGQIEWFDKRQKLIGIKTMFLNQKTVIKLGAEFIRKEEEV